MTNSPRYYTASASLFRKKSSSRLSTIRKELPASRGGLFSRPVPLSRPSLLLISRIPIPDPLRSPSGVLRESRSSHPPAGNPGAPAPAQIPRAPPPPVSPLSRAPPHLPGEPGTAPRILIFPAPFRRPHVPPRIQGVLPDAAIHRSPQPAQCQPALSRNQFLRCPVPKAPARNFPLPQEPCRPVTLSRLFLSGCERRSPETPRTERPPPGIPPAVPAEMMM